VLAALVPDILDSVRVLADDQKAALSRQRDDIGAFHFEGGCGRSSSAGRSGLVRLSFAVSRTARPCGLQVLSSDRRSLGIAVNWTEICTASR
jgi:hypothetical protein